MDGSKEHASANTRARKRTANACRRCKRRKVKCSGQAPCQNCQVKDLECIFDDGDRRLVVSQKHFRDLQSKINAYESRNFVVHPPDVRMRSENGANNGQYDATSTSNSLENLAFVAATVSSPADMRPGAAAAAAAAAPDPDPDPGRNMFSDVTNPLTDTPSQFVTDPQGNKRYLGHSSTWSFSWQVRNLLKTHLNDFTLHDETPTIEGSVYGMASALDQESRSRRIEAIPPREYVEYLAHAVEFHLGSVYHFFDRAAFLRNLYIHYASELDGTQQPSGLQRTELLLIIAFGKLLLGRQATEFGPPGAEYYVRAMSSLPNVNNLNRQPILAVEVLCLTALYLQCADMRNAAYIYVGQAMRIALSQGLNRDIDPFAWEPEEYQHRLKLWWSVYILDRKISILMGAPFSLNDHNDINVPLPEISEVPVSTSSQVLTLNIFLSRLLGKIMTTVYRLNGRLDKSFLEGVQDTLTIMTGLAKTINEKAPLSTEDSSATISRSAATLHLTYHHCAILAIRPILFFLIQKRLASGYSNYSTRTLSEPIKALLNTCVEAAVASLKILSTLQEQDLIELFLPFDSEHAFSSAFMLLMATIAETGFSLDSKCMEIAEYILHNMASRGNMTALCYEMEVKELKEMAASLRTEIYPEVPQSDDSFSGNATEDVAASSWMDEMNLSSNANWGMIYSTMQPNAGILDSDFLDIEGFDMLDDQWFWAQSAAQIPGHVA